MKREKERDLGYVLTLRDEAARTAFDGDPVHESLKMNPMTHHKRKEIDMVAE